MRAHTRLGSAIVLTCLSLISIILLLPNSTFSTHLQKITLGSTIDEYAGLWGWGIGDDFSPASGGIRLVVFGDSWVDDLDSDIEDGRGTNWVDVLCEEINCTSHLNFAVSQPPASYPAAPPTGALTSNSLYLSTLLTSPSFIPPPPEEDIVSDMLPDLADQIQSFLALPPPYPRPRETVFVVSFGIWDIYHFAGLDYVASQNLTDFAIYELFNQLDILYNNYKETLVLDQPSTVDLSPTPTPSGSLTNRTASAIQPFRVIIPKLFDPTLLPGWLASRPLPLTPSTVAEHQKNAVYLSTRWNSRLENMMGTWIRDDTMNLTTAKAVNTEHGKDEVRESSTASSGNSTPSAKTPGEKNDSNVLEANVKTITVGKDVFYYDMPKYLTDVILEHQLEDEGLSDASGLGTGESPFESVYLPCVRAADESPREGDKEVNGFLVCLERDEFLFWDDFNLGPMANEAIGKEVAKIMKEGGSVKKTWADGKGH